MDGGPRTRLSQALARAHTAEERLALLEDEAPETVVWPGLTAGVALQRVRSLLTPPPAAPPGCAWRPNVVYGSGRGRPLELHAYARGAADRRPGILFLHGGGWSGGHPYQLGRLAHAVAAAGYVTATIQYRLSSEARWPAPLEDAKCAVRWVRSHGHELGVDPDRVAVVGASAGGQLAAMVALTPGRFEGRGGWADVSSAVQATVLYNPVLDLREGGFGEQVRAGGVRGLLGALGDELEAEASPITNVTARCPPTAMRVGDLDDVAPAATCEAFRRALRAAGVSARLDVSTGHGHGIPQSDPDGCLRTTMEFLAEHLPAV